MKRSTRWAAALVLTLAPLAGVTYAYPQWPEDAGLDLWRVPALRAELDQGTRQREQLDASLQATQIVMARKTDISLEVIAGRKSLRDAAREFQALNAGNAEFARTIRYKYPDCPESDLHARNVIDTVDHLLEQHPQRAEAVNRLRSELEQMERGAAN